ncbi:hypothetical protein E4U09_006007 [Claviceps aff. purpurea]|uniref:PalI protein n=1 Tax=Claviceps aff. purpurea TaxID=1967640 RepID=A0A9P7QG04_9HYPO|nr:hypothetical protein E4U09_006007 [Claviceps aff. purpurea]
MGLGSAVHHIGTFCLVVALVLFIVVTITAPVVNGLSMMHVDLGRNAASAEEVTFGTFGYCVRSSRGDDCTSSRVGYNPAALMRRLDGTPFNDASANTAKALTRVMVLHPVALGLCFIASLLLCISSGVVGSLLASLVSLAAFLAALVAMICDFVALGIVKRHVNDHNVSHAKWGSGIWLVLVAALLTLLGAAIVFVTCCCGRESKSRRRRAANEPKEPWHMTPATAERGRARGRFW